MNNKKDREMFISEDNLHSAKITKHGNTYLCSITNIATQKATKSYKCSKFNKTRVREIKRLAKKEFNINIDY